MTMRNLEVCCDSVQSAIVAAAAGAARIELCTNLSIGGTTPSQGLISLAREQVDVKLHILVRPRGGDFCYDRYERETMRRDIESAKRLQADGVVFGMLLPDGSIDVAGMQELCALARPLQITFHRAFDLAKEPTLALEQVISLGANFLLTSGQQPTAYQGRELIRCLHQQAADRILVMPGSGVNETNIRELAVQTGVAEFHSSASTRLASRMQFHNQQVSLSASKEQDYYQVAVSSERVRRMVAELSSIDL